jgi:outer membrane protein
MGGRGLRIMLLAGACALAAPAFGQATPPAQPVPDGVVDTLQEALSRAYQDNPTVLAARANQRATDENVPIERADLLPNLSLAPTYTEFLKQSASSFSAPTRSLGAQLSLSVPVYSGGANRNSLEAAKTRVLAGREDLRATESSVCRLTTSRF